ncbi:hypothetical protein BV20DRAFT_547092 [Pilatotrama ljubarskyi]|nr:hypothetical protein BV20DRAFT_547092 [Pilatotrama ljubarskyi]
MLPTTPIRPIPTRAPSKVQFSLPAVPATRSQSAERRTLRSPPPKPKAKLFSRPQLRSRTSSSSSSTSTSSSRSTSALKIRRLGDGGRLEMDWDSVLPGFRPYDYTLLSLAEAQARDEIVHRMFPSRV